jgi:hypothetical protein
MASTKQMQDRAKARRQQLQVTGINEEKFLELMFKMADTMIKQDPNQDYTQTETSLDIAKMIVGHYNIAGSNFNQMLKFRDTFEAGINKNYNTNLFTGINAFMIDTESVMKQASVPKNIRVMSGLLDTLIAVISIRSGFTKFVKMETA